jgi:hypothetical protein
MRAGRLELGLRENFLILGWQFPVVGHRAVFLRVTGDWPSWNAASIRLRL